MKRMLAATLIALLGAVPVYGQATQGEVLERILVKVNGEIFTKTDLEERQIATLRQEGHLTDPRQLEDEVQLQRLLDEITPRILVETINEMLLVQRGRELGYRMTDDRFQLILDNIRQENQIETEEQFQEALRQEGLTMAELRRSIEKQMIIAQVQQIEVLSRVGITEAEARAFYEANRERFTTPAEVTLREIFIEVPVETAGGQRGFSVARADEAQARAEDIRQRVLEGGDFGRIASRESDAPSRANAGLVGPINPAELAPVFRDALAGLQEGEMTEPIRTPRGYHLLQLVSRSESTVVPFADARDQIADLVWDEKRQAEYVKYLDRLRDQAIIEWRSEEARQAFERGLQAERTTMGAADPVEATF